MVNEGKRRGFEELLVDTPEGQAFVQRAFAFLQTPESQKAIQESFLSPLRDGQTEPYHIGLKLRSLIEELAGLYNLDPNVLEIWQGASQIVTAREEVIVGSRLLRKARSRLETVKKQYLMSWAECFVPLFYHGLVFTDCGNFSETLNCLFPTGQQVLEELRKSTGKDLKLSALRLYTSLGLIEKPVRAGEKGRAYYSPTTILRLRIILDKQSDGLSIAEIKGQMPNLLREALQHTRLLKMVDPQMNRMCKVYRLCEAGMTMDEALDRTGEELQ